MKNYKKIYKRLIKEIKDFKRSETDNGVVYSSFDNYREAIERSYSITLFKVLNEIIDEVSGKKWHNQIMSEKEFKQ